MYPVICKIGPFNIYSYGLMLVVAFAVSSTLARLQAKKENINSSTTLRVDGERDSSLRSESSSSPERSEGRSRTINPDIIFNFSFVVFISGIIGARILYIIQNLSYYLKNPLETIMLQQGGLSWFGGLLFGLVSGIMYLKKKNLSVYKILDLIIPFVALAQAIGRIGCLLNGCCFGRVSKFGIYFAVHNSILIPTQIYSSLSLIFIFIILRFLQERPHKEGKIFFAYLLFYSVKRFFIEFWRADNEIIFLGLTLFQVISIVIFFFALWKFILIKKVKINH